MQKFVKRVNIHLNETAYKDLCYIQEAHSLSKTGAVKLALSYMADEL